MPKVLKKKNKIVKKKIRKIVKTTKKLTTKKLTKTLKLIRFLHNPIIEPRAYSWESQAVFNPAAVYANGRFHLFYRALGNDGISRIGYASSKDGINFDERLSYPIYFVENAEEMKRHWPFTSPAQYDIALYASGGGWGGCEDPRTVLMNGHVYMTFNVFNGWDSMRVAVTSIKRKFIK